MPKSTAKKKTKAIKILLVDDDETISEVEDKKFTLSGHEVVSTLNSTKVMHLAEQESPDVIILDLMMTRMSGEEVLKALKSDDELKDIPVIIFSNKGMEQDMAHLLNAGAAKTLVKSNTSLKELVEVVEDLVKK